MNQPPTLPVPGVLLAGKYRVERLLGRGGMGAVFAAQHEVLGRRVAIKVLLTDTAQSEEGLHRFLNEARAAARLESEHVARLMDFGTLENGLPFMVLEYLAGQDLGEVLAARGPLPVVDVVDYVLQACEALAQAHAAGIIHRDLKPSNMFLAQRMDGSLRIKVLDFGISKINDPSSLTPKSLTSTRALLGTPYYMSPEQLARPKEVDARTDIWQLGANIYELLTGSPPFMCDSLGELFFAIMNGPIPSIRAKRPDVSAELEQAVMRCLERDISRRYANVGELAQAIAPFGSGAHAPLVARVAQTLHAGGGSTGGASPFRVTPAPAARSGAATSLQTSNAWGHASGAPVPPAPRRGPVMVAMALCGVVAVGAVAVVLGIRVQSHRAASSLSVAPPQASAAANPPPEPSATSSEVPLVPPAPVTLTPLAVSSPSASVDPPHPAASAAVDAGAKAPPPPPRWVTRPYAPYVPPPPQKPPTAAPIAPPPNGIDHLPDNSRQ
jgi:serine/threonine-protein kinase